MDTEPEVGPYVLLEDWEGRGLDEVAVQTGQPPDWYCHLRQTSLMVAIESQVYCWIGHGPFFLADLRGYPI